MGRRHVGQAGYWVEAGIAPVPRNREFPSLGRQPTDFLCLVF